ncbi:MAG TPA: hypothetical protein VLR91_07790, partial [Thermodesulfobacteriota bacterium]|nr:hypothetical protein [Thermodesulfobacteriota bacterium]
MGISANPGQLKGLEGFSGPGGIWVANLGTGKRVKISLAGTYRSPLFLAGEEDLLALKGGQVVRIRGKNGM